MRPLTADAKEAAGACDAAASAAASKDAVRRARTAVAGYDSIADDQTGRGIVGYD